MKQVMILSIVLLAAIAVVAPVHAGVAWSTNQGAASNISLGSGSNGNRPVATYGLSSNVFLDYTTDTEHMNYVLGSVHHSGNRGFGSANSTTLIYYQSKNTGVDSVGTMPTPATDASFTSGTWTAM